MRLETEDLETIEGGNVVICGNLWQYVTICGNSFRHVEADTHYLQLPIYYLESQNFQTIFLAPKFGRLCFNYVF